MEMYRDVLVDATMGFSDAFWEIYEHDKYKQWLDEPMDALSDAGELYTDVIDDMTFRYDMPDYY